MALRCVSPYRGAFKYKPIAFDIGQEIDDSELEAYLLKDSSASFEQVSEAPEANGAAIAEPKVETKAMETPPADKMVKAPQAKKAAGNGK